jgi:dienelactone hydrolase
MPTTSAESVAADFFAELARGDWAAAVARFDPKMGRAMPASRLASLWQQVLSTQGDWVRIDRYATEQKGPYSVALVDARFSHRRQRLRVTVDATGRIAGFFRGPVREDAEREARALVEALARGNAERAAQGFDARMRAALPPAQALEAWNGMAATAGAFEGIDGVTFENERGLPIVLVECRMHGQPIVTRVVFDPDGDVAGLFFQPAQSAAREPLSYADPTLVMERDVKVGSAPALPGTLTLPKDARGVPGVVLVHGSGPQDRDETIGATRVFRDLALGLSSRGVAVIRYEKRTRVDPLGVVTQKEEVVDPALAAIDVLRKQPEVDPQRVVVVGHSQGGALAPRIAQADGRLAGIAVLAGPTRSLQDSIVAQFTYLSSIQPASAALRKAIGEAVAFKKATEDPALRPDADLVVPGGGRLTGAYLLDARGFHPEQIAETLPCAVLVLQGERDYQVTFGDDFQGWRRALSGNPRATLTSYPTLDHRFVAGDGASSPAQYGLPGHVDAQVVSDVAAWIAGLAPYR